MHALDLNKSRKHSEVKLANGKTYKIPNEFTVEEVERVLELQIERDALEKQEVSAEADAESAEVKRYMEIVFMQLEILFQHYQPEVTAEFLKAAMTQTEALEALGFFQKYRHAAVRDYLANKNQPQAESKKKVAAKTELRDLRRLITFMVVEGFSLFDLKRLYIDEIYSYYEQLVFTMEKTGKMAKGSYAKIVRRSKGGEVDPAKQLRMGMLAAFASKGAKK